MRWATDSSAGLTLLEVNAAKQAARIISPHRRFPKQIVAEVIARAHPPGVRLSSTWPYLDDFLAVSPAPGVSSR
jgi:hypothetical protein